jgi:hypothetical protein
MEELFLILRGTPAALDVELDAVARGIRCGLAEGAKQRWITVGHGRIVVIEDRYAVRDDTVSHASYNTTPLISLRKPAARRGLSHRRRRLRVRTGRRRATRLGYDGLTTADVVIAVNGVDG